MSLTVTPTTPPPDAVLPLASRAPLAAAAALHASSGWRTFWSRVAGRGRALMAAGATIRRIIGAPDYDAYLRHHHARHPDSTPLTRDEFARQRLEARYCQPGNRCC